MFGPSMYPEVPKEALEGNSDPDKIWKPSDEKEASRRTIYAFIKRSFRRAAAGNARSVRHNAAQRQTPDDDGRPASLTLFNGDFVNRQAKHFAERLRKEAGNDIDRQVEQAYRLALCRAPTDTNAP